VFIGLIILVTIRLIVFRKMDGYWNWRKPALARIDLTNGAINPIYDEPKINRWEKKLDAALNSL